MRNTFSIVTVSIILCAEIISKINTQDVRSRSSHHITDEKERRCADPDRLEGVCKSIKQCPAVLNEFLARSNESDYIGFLRQSNVNCDNIKPFICCPNDGRKINLPENNFHGRLLTPDEGCGFSNKNIRIKFGGGHSAKVGAFPWIALIGYVNNFGKTSWECGGTLITTRHILTAASCITPNLSVVRLGEIDITSPLRRGVEDIRVIRSVQHQHYNPQDGTDNIAILYLERDVPISGRIRPICLPINEPIRSRSFVDYNPFVAGWGRSREGGLYDVMYEANLPVLGNEKCKDRHRERRKIVSTNQFDDGVICAGIGHQDNCINDIGGPLIQPIYEKELEEFRYYQIGVASYGVSCKQTDTPSVYAKVQHFIDWIQEKVRQ